MKHFKKFETHQLYETYKSSLDFVTPNVSLCVQQNEVHYNPFHDYSQDYLTFEALEDGTFKFTNPINYSVDNGTTWTALAANTNTPTITAGNKIMWKAELIPSFSNPKGIGTFSSTDNFNVEGNPLSLLYGDNFIGQTDLTGKNYTFRYLFSNCSKLINAKNISLPATTLVTNCYSYMFNGCTVLTTAPELPATALADYCYSNMFAGCTSLTVAPELPATTLAGHCYQGMFNGCTSLITAPELPATTLTSDCYGYMFYNCIALTTAPELPATTLEVYCYEDMFYNCSSLITAPELPATTLVDYCYQFMFYGCTSLTTAPELPATTLTYQCYYYMFSGCTALTSVPVLPATTLASWCYAYMFQDCTELTIAPELPATTLVNSCYQCMFNGCSSLNYMKCLVTEPGNGQYTNGWLYGASTTGIFVKDSNINNWIIGVSGIPEGWIAINEGEAPIMWESSSFNIAMNASQNNINKIIKLINIDNLPITFSSSDSNIATINNLGIVTLITTGSCSLTATFAGNSKYEPKTVTCNLNIVNHSYEYDYMAITSLEDNNNIIWKTSNTSISKTISVSADNGITWTEITSTTSGTTLGTLNTNNKILIKGYNYSYGDFNNYNYFTSTGQFNISGNIMSLIYGDDFVEYKITSNYAFSKLFKDCSKLINAEHFILLATTLANYCYANMFYDCTSLTTAPELPATTLAESCYERMFYGCTALTTAPSTLPATTLANYCYNSMFSSCTSLTSAPELPATRLASNCYYSMFQSCSSLNYIKCLANVSNNSYVYYWTYGVASTGVFVKDSNANNWEIGVSGIPSGWTVQTA